MLIVDMKTCREIISMDKAALREILSPLRENMDIRYSLAHAKVKPGEATLPHKIKSSEVYYIMSGDGEMYINDEVEVVRQGHVIYIPANSIQYIKNMGNSELIFLCIVDPPWKAENEELVD